MPRIPDAAMQNVTLTGPLWSAQIDILKLGDPEQNWAFRTLFVDLTPRDRLGQSNSLLPGTMIVLAIVRQVVVRLGESERYEWRMENPPLAAAVEHLSEETLRTNLTAGKWALLLVQASPAAWPNQFPNSSQSTYFPPSLTCLAGEIFLGLDKGLKAQGQAERDLYTRLGLGRTAESEFDHLLSPVSVHSSGLSLYGQVQVPWQTEPLAAPFLLTQDFPPTDNPTLRLRPEKNRFTLVEVETWVQAWQQLNQYLKPETAETQVTTEQTIKKATPQWVTLELTTANQVPDLFRLISMNVPSANGFAELHIEPDEFSLIVSDRPLYDGQNPPESLARITPTQSVTISGTPVSLEIKLKASTVPAQSPSATATSGEQLKYSYKSSDSSSEEFFSADELKTAFSPIEVPRFLRNIQRLPDPDTIPTPTAVVWGFMPLDNGWAELPFANLTEQLYLNNELEQSLLATASSLVQGAVSLGNESVLSAHPDEQPWNITWTDAEGIDGEWKYAQTNSNGEVTLQEIKLTIHNPTVILSGFMWLSAQPSQITDALPDLDNWVNGLRSFALKTSRPDRDLFPSPMLMAVRNLRVAVRTAQGIVESSAELENWQLNYRIDDRPVEKYGLLTVFQQMSQKLSFQQFTDQHPLIWQRHDRLPMIQALPLTQSQVPPNYPSASRQLVPYEVPLLSTASVSGLTFTAAGANTWLQTDAQQLNPAREWRSQPDLPLVSLSLPGLLLTPSQTNQQLTCQYRFDLPYTDEVNAFAQLPEVSQSVDSAIAPLPLDSISFPELQQPLNRDTYAAHWQRLSTRASLASADGVLALDLDSPVDEQGKQPLNHLIEPYVWSVKPSLGLNEYPGSLSLQNGSTLKLEESFSPESQPALEGISGQFAVNGNQITFLGSSNTDDSNGSTFAITAGSLAAKLTPEGLQDQRGLVRGATQVDELWLQTPVKFYKAAEQVLSYALTTTLKSMRLQVGDRQWYLWFRDLPLRLNQADQTKTGQFLRQERLSDTAQDVNDPESRSRNFDFLSSYEWRLSAQEASAKAAANGIPPYLPLFNLHFYPLTLEQVDLQAGNLQKVVMIGRLQLPLTDKKELEDFSNAVRLEFSGENGNLQLQAIALVGSTISQDTLPAQGEWPLALVQGEAFDAPLLVWHTVELMEDQNGILIKDATLKFVLFDYLWSVPLQLENDAAGTALRFLQTQINYSNSYTIPASNQALYLKPKTLTLTIDLQTRNHAVDLDLNIQLGSSDRDRHSFTAEVQFPMLREGKPASPRWRTAQLFGVIPITVSRGQLAIHQQAFQFHWQTVSLPTEIDDQSSSLQLLPGIPLLIKSAQETPLPGFVALTFDVQSQSQQESSTTTSDIPLLVLTSAAVEALLSCQWGTFLQTEADPLTASSPTDKFTQVFGSSAGDLTCGYTADWQIKQESLWQETLIFNGMMEIKNLISWPAELTVDANTQTDAEPTLTTVLLPALQSALEQRNLNHHRHTLRILLNQHLLPLNQITQSRRPDRQTLFHLAADAAWEFLAVVEHQLTDVEIQQTANGTLEVKEIKGDRRWTTTQPIRWLSPTQFKQQLEKLNNAHTPDPTTGTAKGGSGFFDSVFRQALIHELEQLSQSPTLLVEASAHLWLNQTPLTTVSPTTLQFLPNGCQLGILSNPDNYNPSDPKTPAWLLLTMPFLGRVQLPDADTAKPANASPLRIDPILCLNQQQPVPLALMLTTRQPAASNATPMRLVISGLDTAAGRSWSRLDPLSLQESWFRLQHPVVEPPPDRLQSVMAAQPDSPARLSRSIALKQNVNRTRRAVPPQETQLADLPNSLVDQSVKTEIAPAGLQVLYLFQGGARAQVKDVSGVGEPLDLALVGINRDSRQESWRWEGDGLRILQSSVLRSAAPATKLMQACLSTNELTIEAWIEPNVVDQTQSLGRIVTLSEHVESRNVSLQHGVPERNQRVNKYGVRIRTTTTNREGEPSQGPRALTIATSPQLERIHLVCTHDRDGNTRLYLNGELAAQRQVVGNFSNWGDFYLALANEPRTDGSSGSDRPWLGKYYRVAIYNRALTLTEVRSQFSQGYTAPPLLAHPWLNTGLQIATSNFGQPPTKLNRYAAAILLPPQSQAETQPQSLAISPYLGLLFQPAGGDYVPSLVAAELLCLDQATRTLRSIASHFWEVPALPSEASSPTEMEWANQQRQQINTTSIEWAKSIHGRLCPESPVAILRFREIFRLLSQAPFAAPIITGYSFQVVDNLEIAELPLKRTLQLRSQMSQLRFSEGQWGGTSLPPVDLKQFEIAPPQTTGVQPLYLTERPGQGDWPWGISTLRVSVRHADAGVNDVLQDQIGTLWWQAPQHAVQYRTSSTGITAGLPALFRARAIPSLLPIALQPSMPTLDQMTSFTGGEATGGWQAILPGTMRYLLLGDRPGVFFNLRNQLLRQTDTVFVSGSIPAQHRMPRPVPLPPPNLQSNRLNSALQPWASYFNPQRSVWVTDTPADTAFLGENLLQKTSPQGLQMWLMKPDKGGIPINKGGIPINWDGLLKFGLEKTLTPLTWEIEKVSAIVGRRVFTFTEKASANNSYEYKLDDSSVPDLKDELALLGSGSTLSIQARIKLQTVNNQDDGFRQSLSFTLRLMSDRTLPLPLQPRFIQFEDPEYNRQLASPTAHVSTQVAISDSEQNPTVELAGLRLASDRREYNSNSSITCRYDWMDVENNGLPTDIRQARDGKFTTRELQIKRIRSGIETILSLPNPTLNSVNSGTLYSISLAELKSISDTGSTEVTAVLRPHDTVQLVLQLFKELNSSKPDSTLILTVTIVAVPVQPTPEAAYGLLRQNPNGGVECVRFAWGVIPNRVDLINPDDLKTEVVRRRGVFQWTDTVRSPRRDVADQQNLKDYKYGIQKITQSGSTCLLDFVPVSQLVDP